MKSILNKIVKNKKLFALIIIIAVILVIAGLYGTFASNSTVAGSNDTYTITLTDSSNTINIPANSSKTVIYKVTNTNKGVVKYGIGYSGTNISVKIYNNSPSPETGLFDYGDTKFVKLYITNSGSSNSTATITSVLGYENGGELIVPSGVTLVTEVYNVEQNATFVVSKLFSKTGTVKENPNGGTNAVDLEIDTTNQLIKDKNGNIRYYGTGINSNSSTYIEPNNYIDIGDNVLWRIIGVFDGKLKLIRSSSIGNYSWDTSENTITTNSGNGINEWSQSDVMKLLNPGYTGTGGSLYWESKRGDCYTGQSNATTSCNFEDTGLSSSAKNKIADATWNLGGWNANILYPNKILEYENGNTTVTNPADGITRTTTWTGKIGLPTPSDFGYATDLQVCNRDLYYYDVGDNSSACKKNDWIWRIMSSSPSSSSQEGGSLASWFMTPSSGSPYNAYRLTPSAYIIHNSTTYSPYAIVPTLYLKQDVLIDGGNGTSSNPYIIKDPPTAASTISKLFNQNDTVTSNGVPHQVDTTHQLIKDEAGNIRYYGTGITDTGGTYKEPNNYIDIGDRDSSDNLILWRIIGVFNGKLKLIRSSSIGKYSWDTSANASATNNGRGINEWSQADIMKLLNPGYENNQDLNSSGSTITVNNSLWYKSKSGTCYISSSNATQSCDFTSTGLSENAKDKIADETWNIGGWNSTFVYPNEIYGKERGTTVISSPADEITRTTSWTGKIGLAYPSDYGYATDLSQCNQNLYNYSNAGENNTYPCRGNNWMWYTMSGATSAALSGNWAWLITPYSSDSFHSFAMGGIGHIYPSPGQYNAGANAICPVMYINSQQTIESGSGTSSDPYVLS